MSDSYESDSFKSSLAAFAFMPRSSGLGISKKRTLQSFHVPQVCDEHIHGDGLQVHGGTSGLPLKKKRVRGYADPEVYAHLQGLPDILSEGLDSEKNDIVCMPILSQILTSVIFCGIKYLPLFCLGAGLLTSIYFQSWREICRDRSPLWPPLKSFLGLSLPIRYIILCCIWVLLR